MGSPSRDVVHDSALCVNSRHRSDFPVSGGEGLRWEGTVAGVQVNVHISRALRQIEVFGGVK